MPSSQSVARACAQQFIAAFFKIHFARIATRGRYVELQSLSELDAPFARFWRRSYQLHRGHCQACAKYQNCAYGDALSLIRYGPIDGVSEHLRRHILTNGQFDLVTGRVTLLLPEAA